MYVFKKYYTLPAGYSPYNQTSSVSIIDKLIIGSNLRAKYTCFFSVFYRQTFKTLSIMEQFVKFKQNMFILCLKII